MRLGPCAPSKRFLAIAVGIWLARYACGRHLSRTAGSQIHTDAPPGLTTTYPPRSTWSPTDSDTLWTRSLALPKPVKDVPSLKSSSARGLPLM